MRIAIAEFKQETNSFVPFTTTLQTFEEQYLHRGEEILTSFGEARLEIPGVLDAIREAGATPLPLLATMAMGVKRPGVVPAVWSSGRLMTMKLGSRLAGLGLSKLRSYSSNSRRNSAALSVSRMPGSVARGTWVPSKTRCS